jgi:hypothetical protein
VAVCSRCQDAAAAFTSGYALSGTRLSEVSGQAMIMDGFVSCSEHIGLNNGNQSRTPGAAAGWCAAQFVIQWHLAATIHLCMLTCFKVSLDTPGHSHRLCNTTTYCTSQVLQSAGGSTAAAAAACECSRSRPKTNTVSMTCPSQRLVSIFPMEAHACAVADPSCL